MTFTYATPSPYKFLDYIVMALKVEHGDLWVLIRVHLQSSFTPLGQTEQTPTEREITSSPHRIGSSYSQLWDEIAILA